MKHTLSDIAAKCDEADMVLVGIGEEFQYDWDILLRNERYQEIEKEIEQKEKKEREEKNWIYLESISYLNSDWNLFCALFSKTGVSSSYEVRFGSVSTQIEDSDEPHLNSCRS